MQNDLHVIIGMGLSGFSCARYLESKKIPFAMMDTRYEPPELEKFKALYPKVLSSFGQLDEAILDQAHTIVLSPSIALATPIIQKYLAKDVPVIGDIELFARDVRVPVIAITGTNAKSTVTTLVGKMAEEARIKVKVGGNLGIPALDLLLDAPYAELFILELSSFQLETTSSLKPEVATVLNVSEDHMDRYKTLADYTYAKQSIYKQAKKIVCNKDDLLTFNTAAKNNLIKPAEIYFTLQSPATNEFGLRSKNNENYLAFGEELLLPVKDLPVMGKHYQANALAALAIGYAYGISFAPMLQALKKFKGLAHRCVFVGEKNKIKWYNDSKGTNVGATLAAINGIGSELQGKIILIAGGVGKNADFTPLLPAFKQYCKHIVLIGEAAPELAKLIANVVPNSFAKNMQEAVMQAAEAASENDCVLLSPACASLDMFKNFAHRGEVFVSVVQTEVLK